MRFPSITTTALLIGLRPVPSMRVPPSSTTVGAWARAFSEPRNIAIVTSHAIRDLIICVSPDIWTSLIYFQKQHRGYDHPPIGDRRGNRTRAITGGFRLISGTTRSLG